MNIESQNKGNWQNPSHAQDTDPKLVNVMINILVIKKFNGKACKMQSELNQTVLDFDYKLINLKLICTELIWFNTSHKKSK